MPSLPAILLIAATTLTAATASSQSFTPIDTHPDLNPQPRPAFTSDPAAAATTYGAAKVELPPASYTAFRSYAIALRLGLGGIGGEIATPLGRHIRLRAGGGAFSYSTTFTTNGLTGNGTLKIGEVFGSLDLHPFANGFRISPGLNFRNPNAVTAVVNYPGGQSFTLNDVNYTSEVGDPVTGNASVVFGNKVAPRITLGVGNMFPKSGGHWSFPFEIGAEYTDKPVLALTLSGSACNSQGCGSINTPDNLANINGEIAKIQNDLNPYSFFPILSFGIGYRFGH